MVWGCWGRAVKQISVVPWEVVGDEVGKRYSVMDLGQDSPVIVSSADKNIHRASPILISLAILAGSADNVLMALGRGGQAS